MPNNHIDTPDVLVKILKRKREEIASRQRVKSIADLNHMANEQSKPRGFVSALNSCLSVGKSAVIAEVKKASPSKGVIRADFDPESIAVSYEQAGAACLSVLTDKDFFQGHEDYLVAARNAVKIPVIRKDFLIVPYQIHEARAIGADCVLLIVAAFANEFERLKDLYQLSESLGMDVLVEVHNEAELALAMDLDLDLIGINNRNLHDFSTDLATTVSLAKRIPDSTTIVTESGIHSREDVHAMRSHGINAFLVGEAFMRAENPGDALSALFFTP